jgi:uncharacterized protein (DUF1015 family)
MAVYSLSMAKIRPLRAQRFAPHLGELAHLVAPPYDVISSAGREDLGSQNPYNTVWLTIPETEQGDRSQFVKYGRSSARLSAWREEGALVLDDQPNYYRYRQTFIDPVSGDRLTRESLITLLKVEPYSKGVVLPHEQTFPKHKEDRLRLLEATRTHLECIYGLYESSGRLLDSIEFAAVAEVTTDDGIVHELAKTDDPTAIDTITAAFEDKKLWIADGHHRYETAVAFREALGEHDDEIPEDFMMIALSAMDDPGLILLPTHRIVENFPVPPGQVEEKLRSRFQSKTVANHMIAEALAKTDRTAFGVALPGGTGIVATMNDSKDALSWIHGEGSDLLKMLDVTILHEAILKDLFGIVGMEKVGYTRDVREAIDAAEVGSNTVSFLMNPPSVSEMRQIALGGEKMPQKSTYYYPKLLSGLVFWSMSDW